MLGFIFVRIDSNDVSSTQQLNNIQTEATLDNKVLSNSNSESDEEDDYVRRSTSFLRFGRGMSPSSGSFLRFGREMSPSSGSFLRFGREMSPSSGSFLRFGRSNPSFLRFGRGGQNGATFLRFGRRAQQYPPSNIHRSARKGEFLRFG
jgi:hypothetical protein